MKNRIIGLLTLSVVMLSLPSEVISDEPDLKSSTVQFLKECNEPRRKQILLPMDHGERTDWSYFPGERKGLSFAEMDRKQKKAAQGILRSGLSETGYLKANGIIHLEEILSKLENAPDYRDPEKYYFTIFGDPEQEEAWGVRVEGHHLSLNFTGTEEQVISGTPAFFGANPAVVPRGTYAGKEVLAAEQRLARKLIQRLSPSKRETAIFRNRAYSEIVTGNQEKASLDSMKGLPASEMSDAQQDTLMELVRVYTGNFHETVSKKLFDKFQNGFPGELYFGWAGGIEPGEPHYYRIHAPGIVIEYDNAKDNVNHIHSVIRDLDGDFGKDVLAEHYRNSSHRHD